MKNKLNQTQIKKLHIISIIMSSIFILFGNILFTNIFPKYILWIICIICFILSILSFLLCIYGMLKIKSNIIQIINLILVTICLCLYSITTIIFSPFFHIYKDTEIGTAIYNEDAEFENDSVFQVDSD